ncbi:MAG: sigma-70 family RNA polymerase sigma factor [Clostridia bacterium]|nr:sigma-70 family RNA polymerase sigma factor [Clostridia bacterium]
MNNALPVSKVSEDRISCLMAAYGTSVLRMCYAYLKDTGLAEDAAQDAFIKAYRYLDRIDACEVKSEKAWLMRIAVNTCKDYRRTAWFRHVDRTEEPEHLLYHQQAQEKEEQQLIDDVMALPPRYKTVILLHYYQDLRVTEIAGILGIACSTVYNRLEKAQQKLRVKLERGVPE